MFCCYGNNLYICASVFIIYNKKVKVYESNRTNF